MNQKQLISACEQKALATIKALKERGYGDRLPLPRLSTLWKIDHLTEISGWWQGQLSPGFSAPKFLVGYSVCLESDDKLWLHLSISKKEANKTRCIPTYKEAQEICKLFYSDKWHIQYFPPTDEYVNLAEVLHFWHCLESNPLPDFRKFGGI